MSVQQTIRPEELSSDLLDLARRPDEATAFRLWVALDPEDREEAVRTLLTAEFEQEEAHRQELLDTIAETFNFRPQTLRSWETDRVAQYGRHLQVREPTVLRALLRTLHVYSRPVLLQDFLDELGVPHENGVVPPDAEPPDVSQDQVEEAAGSLLARHGARLVVPYFLTLLVRGTAFAAGVDKWLRKVTPEVEEVTESASATEVGEEVPDEAIRPRRLESTNEFTTIDRLFVRAVADVGQGIEGALTEDQLEDAVEELLALNSSRHRSFFHAGFMDGELGDDPRPELPAQNPDRLRWYWAGYLSALARREQHEEIAGYYDREDAVRALGQSADGASHSAARLVFEALCRCDRPGEAASFLEVDTVLGNPMLVGSLRREGTRLLREDKAAEAHGIFDLLGKTVEALEEVGVDTTTRNFLQIRRRRSHCYRQLGETAAARELLERLLEEERDPEIRSMVHTDLGLIDAGFRRLADLRVPDSPEQMEAFLEALEEGEPRFRQGAEMDVKHSAHGQYCLGVMALLREEYDAAVGHLDRALSVFESNPDRYRPGGLLANVRAYLGMAIFLALETGRMERAAQLVQTGIREGADVPNHFVRSMVEAAEIRSPELARMLAESLLEAEGDPVLDMLADTEAANGSPVIADALLERAQSDDRGDVERVRDHITVLPMLLGQDRTEEAARVLDALEKAAIDGVERQEFLELVSDPDRYEPAWAHEDAIWARIQCLESAGEYEQAASLLEDEFHQILASEPFGAATMAEGLIDQIESYGLEGDRTDHLKERLEHYREKTRVPAEEEDEGEEEPLPVRILFVGGDERQEADQEHVREAVEERDSRINVSFYHPGWSSNWGSDLEKVKRMLPDQDGVVIMRFIRTEFGRQLRKELEVPWYTCTTAGRRSMTESIVQAARLARRQLRSEPEETG